MGTVLFILKNLQIQFSGFEDDFFKFIKDNNYKLTLILLEFIGKILIKYNREVVRMPRQPRIYSKTDIYHVMIRGINKEKIFLNKIYKSKLLKIIQEINEEVDFSLIAFCVMNNHLHLLIKAGNYELTTFMKKLNIKYAMYYNKSEDRYGHVFQDRFRSKAVEDEEYLFGVLRYIHNNPVKAGITNNMLDYKWSSADNYVKQESDIISNVYLAEILKKFETTKNFIDFHGLDDNIIYIDTKEEESIKKQYIIKTVTNEFVNKYQFTDIKEIKPNQKEELAEELIKLNVFTLKEIASQCNLSISAVCELNKKLKNNFLKTSGE